MEIANDEAATAVEIDEGTKRLVEFMHRMLCQSSHTDQCSWGHEERIDEDPWSTGPSHVRWLGYASRLVSEVGEQAAWKIVPLISEMH